MVEQAETYNFLISIFYFYKLKKKIIIIISWFKKNFADFHMWTIPTKNVLSLVRMLQLSLQHDSKLHSENIRATSWENMSSGVSTR